MFASGVTVLGGEPTLEQSPDKISLHRLDIQMTRFALIFRKRTIWIFLLQSRFPVLRPPPGFLHFSWPWKKWGPDGDPSLFDFSRELPGWCPWGYRGQLVDPPSLLISQIIQDSLDDTVVANVGSSLDESSTPSEAHNLPKPVVEDIPF